MFRALALRCLNALRRGFQWGLDGLYPRDCFFCGRPTGESGSICLDCLQHLFIERGPACSLCDAESMMNESPTFICSDCLQHRPAYERAFVVARYEGDFRALIHTFKYRDGLWLCEDLVRFLYAAYLGRLQPLGIRPEVVVPVPMQPKKRRKRGYNQAELLARGLAKELQIPCRSRLLRRVATGVVSQTRLNRRQRLANALAAYRVRSPQQLEGKTVLLVDDVMTTGATVDACARLLRDAGAEKVYVLVLARGVTL